MASTPTSYRINQLAKDLGVKSKDILEVFEGKGGEKTHMAVLEPDEFEFLIMKLTEKKQVNSIDDYLSGKIVIETAEEKAERLAAEKAAAEKAAAEKAAAEKAAAEKAAAEKAAAEKAAAEKAAIEKAAAERRAADARREAERAAERAAQKNEVKPQDKPQDKPQNQPPRQDRPQQNGPRPAPQGQRDGFRGDRPQGGAPRQDGTPSQFRQNGNQPPRQDRPQQNGPRPAPQGQRDGGFHSDRPQGGAPRQDRPQQNGPKPQKAENRPQGAVAPKPKIVVERGAATRTGGKRVIDTRSGDVDLSKYDERFETLAGDMKDNDRRPDKQKIKKKNNNDGYRKNNAQDKEKLAIERMKKLELEKARKAQLHITVPDEISVGELATRLKVTVGDLIKKLMVMGVMATVNQIGFKNLDDFYKDDDYYFGKTIGRFAGRIENGKFALNGKEYT
ncbi:MAG: translation initiation factor IF-2 N-terminal domain-containing protein, partial [Clostridia bacterium]|nr:translation initiation factor IF-2 N-terminal domain-containing protein [Clostridia bacterium]